MMSLSLASNELIASNISAAPLRETKLRVLSINPRDGSRVGLHSDTAKGMNLSLKLAAPPPGSDIIVFGRFHCAVVRKWNDILFINPVPWLDLTIGVSNDTFCHGEDQQEA